MMFRDVEAGNSRDEMDSILYKTLLVIAFIGPKIHD